MNNIQITPHYFKSGNPQNYEITSFQITVNHSKSIKKIFHYLTKHCARMLCGMSRHTWLVSDFDTCLPQKVTRHHCAAQK